MKLNQFSSEKQWQQHVVKVPHCLIRRMEKRDKRHHSGRKWYFAKVENGGVRTLHHHNKSPILSQDGTDPVSVVQMKPAGGDQRKLKVHFEL